MQLCKAGYPRPEFYSQSTQRFFVPDFCALLLVQLWFGLEVWGGGRYSILSILKRDDPLEEASKLGTYDIVESPPSTSPHYNQKGLIDAHSPEYSQENPSHYNFIEE